MIGRKWLKSHHPIVIYSLWVGFHPFETNIPSNWSEYFSKDLLVKMIPKPLSSPPPQFVSNVFLKTMHMVLLAMFFVLSATGPFFAMDFWHLLVDHVPSLVAAGDLGSNQPTRKKIQNVEVNLWIVRMECLDMFGRLQYILPYLGMSKDFRFRFGQLALLNLEATKNTEFVFWKEPLNAPAGQPYDSSSWPS